MCTPQPDAKAKKLTLSIVVQTIRLFGNIAKGAYFKS